MKKTLFTLVFINFFSTIFCQHYMPRIGGCSLNEDRKPSSYFALYNSSGNPELDAFLSREVFVLRNFFQVSPSFYVFDDSDGANAYAMKNIENSQYPDGTTIFGLKLISNEFQEYSSGTTLPLIIAHEFGHILDYKTKATGIESGKIPELFADYMAGCFLFYRSYQIYTDGQNVLKSFYNKGDDHFFSPTHHGTPNERVSSVMAGYNWLRSISRPGIYISPYQAIAAAKNYLQSNFGFGIKQSNNYTSRNDLYAISSNKDNNQEYHPLAYQPKNSTIGNDTKSSKKLKPLAYNKSEAKIIEEIKCKTIKKPIETTLEYDIYTYVVTVENNNEIPIKLTLGGLSIGYYENCNERRDIILVGDGIQKENIHFEPNEKKIITLTKKLYKNFHKCPCVLDSNGTFPVKAEMDF